MLLSVCLITRNEERFLAGCLDSVRSIADEVVLVDTGSTDSTLEIARRHGCRILERAWDDDFSAARNAGIELAAGEWLLCLDADERLDNPEALPPALRAARPEVGGFWIERHDVVTHPEDGQSDVYPIEIVRAFRNRPEIRYEGIVHERPQESIARAGFALRRLPALKLTHLVNHLPPERLEAKQRRYLRLLELEVERDPRNAWARYYRGKTLWFLRRLEAAEAEFGRLSEDLEVPLPLRASSLCMLAALLAEQGERGEAVEHLTASLALVPGQSLAYYVLAETLYAEGLYARAAQAYARVRLSQDPAGVSGAVLGDLCMTREKRAYKLGCCALALGGIEEAEDRFREGLAAHPEHAGCHYGLARVAMARGKSDAARARLREAARLDPAWRAPREALAEGQPADTTNQGANP